MQRKSRGQGIQVTRSYVRHVLKVDSLGGHMPVELGCPSGCRAVIPATDSIPTHDHSPFLHTFQTNGPNWSGAIELGRATSVGRASQCRAHQNCV